MTKTAVANETGKPLLLIELYEALRAIIHDEGGAQKKGEAALIRYETEYGKPVSFRRETQFEKDFKRWMEDPEFANEYNRVRQEINDIDGRNK